MLHDDDTIREFLHRLEHPVALVGLYPLNKLDHKSLVIWPAEQDDAADQAGWLSRQYFSVYCNLNPLKPYVLDVVPGPGVSVRDKMIVARSRLLVDIDGHDVPKETARIQKDEIKAKYGEPLIETDSGNGYGLIYPLDRPNDDDSNQRARIFLAQLNSEFSCVDTSVWTLGRLTRVIGTLNRSVLTGDRIPTEILN